MSRAMLTKVEVITEKSKGYYSKVELNLEQAVQLAHIDVTGQVFINF